MIYGTSQLRCAKWWTGLRLKQNIGINEQEENGRGNIWCASLNDGSNAGVLRKAQVDYPMGGMIQLNNDEPFYNTSLDVWSSVGNV